MINISKARFLLLAKGFLFFLLGLLIGYCIGTVIFGSLLKLPKRADLPTLDPHSIQQSIKFAANYYGIDPLLIQAIVTVESSGNPNMVGLAGEIGLMQIHPRYHKTFTLPLFNIMAGTKILKTAMKSCPKSYIRCYNGGVNNRNTKQARRYEQKVKKVYRSLLVSPTSTH